MAKQAFELTKGRSAPPIAGPIMPEMFNCKPPTVEAAGSSSLETISGWIDVQAGEQNAKPHPIKKTARKRSHGLSNSDPTTNQDQPAAAPRHNALPRAKRSPPDIA